MTPNFFYRRSISVSGSFWDLLLGTSPQLNSPPTPESFDRVTPVNDGGPRKTTQLPSPLQHRHPHMNTKFPQSWRSSAHAVPRIDHALLLFLLSISADEVCFMYKIIASLEAL
jgi:hypothetical protein